MNRSKLSLVSALLAATALCGFAQTSINVNCGGRDYTAADGTQWVGDYFFNGGDLLYTSDAIVNSQDLPLYRSGRAGLYGDFVYNVPVANGTYNVTLHFAEIQYWNQGDRVFNVVINGSTVLSNFDILANAAPRAAITRQFPVAVSNGAIQIAVNGVTRRGLLNGIQIAPAASTLAPTTNPVLAADSTALTFSGTAGSANPAAQSVAISNSGTGTLTWSASSNQTWLTVSPSSGTNAGTLSVAANLSGLAAGTYTGAIAINGGSAGTKTVAVTLTLAPAPTPALSIGTTALSFSGTAGSSNPAAQSVSITNSGTGGTLSWSASSNQTWLTVSPASGTNAGTLSVAANLSGLAAGTYTGAIAINGGTAGTKTVAVTLTVAPAPTPALSIGTTSLSFSGTAGSSNPAAQSVSITNSGTGGTLSWSASSNQTWLTVSPSSGTNAGTLSVAANLSGLTAGTYTGAIAINGGTAGTKTVAVTLTVAPAPTPALSIGTTSLSFSGTAGSSSPAAQSVSITNSGTGGTLSWSASSNQTWLTVSPASGTNAGTLSVAANLSGLAAATYTGTVTINGGTAGTKTVAVTLTVAPAPTPALSIGTTSLSFSGTAGSSNPAAQSVSITNSGTGGTLSWSASSNQTWLTVSPISGTNAGTLSVAANLSGLTATTYTGTVTINGGTAGTKTVAVTFTVAPAPTPALSIGTTALSFSGTAGSSNPAAQSVSITNSGTGGTLSWSASSNQTWLTVSPASGTNAGTLSVAANLSGLAAGTYTGTVTINGGTAGTKTVAVTFTVAAAAPATKLTALNVNCGGNDYTDLKGNNWVGDYYFNGGDLLYSSDAVTNSQDMPIYRSGRAGLYGDFSYSIPAVNGSYTVTLHFDEIQYWNKGDRIFNVAINGATVLSNFDILSQVAPRTALTAQFPVSVTNGKIQIDVTGVVRKGLLNGIQIGDAALNPIVAPSMTVSTSAMTFSANSGGANPAAQTATITNSGSGFLSYIATSNQSWLTVSPASGSAPATISVQAATGALAQGAYSGVVTLTAGGGVTKTIAVTFNVGAPPPSIMTLSGSSLSFTGTAGGSNPAAQSVTVSNTGAGTMNWTASSNQSWLTVSPASGSNTGVLAIGANLSGLAAGNYAGTITATSAGATGSPKTISVSLAVAAPAPASLTVSSTSLAFAGTVNSSNPSSQSVSVSNAGAVAMPWTASSNSAWLTVSPASGTNSGTLTVAVNITGLAANTYNGAITVDAGTAGAKTVAVALTVANAPTMTLAAAPNAITLNATTGSNPGSTSLGITTTGTPAWTVTKTKNWLTVSQMSGTGAATLSVGASASTMAAGTYTDTITVSSTSTSSPATVAVTLNVTAAQQPPTLPSNGNNWFVSTSGSASGDGSVNNPWDIVTAFNQPASVKPGDTIWLRGGKYGGGQYNSEIDDHLVGTPTLPIIVRAYPKERAIIDAWLLVGCCDGSPNPASGSYTWFWGIEFASYNPNRTSGTSGPPEWAFQYNHQAVDVWGAGTKFINCIVHDTAGGLSVWNAAGTELSGNLVYNIGGYGTDRGHGHNFYLQNAAPSILSVHDNISFNNFDMGLQAYGSSDAPVQNIQLRGNTVFNSGILYGQLVDNLTLGGGAGGPSGMLVDNNFFYDTPTLDQGYGEMGFLWTPRANDAVVTNNYFMGGKQAIDLERWDRLTFRNNKVYANSGEETMLILRADQTTANYDHANNNYYGSGKFQVYTGCDYWPCTTSPVAADFSTWMLLTGLDKGSTFTPGAPKGLWVGVRPNTYEPGRANITIYNWDLNPAVSVDLSTSGIKVGDTYQIRDAENFFNGPIVTGTYTGAPVSIPMMNLTVVQPFGVVPYPPSHTAPQFGTFVLLSGSAMNIY